MMHTAQPAAAQALHNQQVRGAFAWLLLAALGGLLSGCAALSGIGLPAAAQRDAASAAEDAPVLAALKDLGYYPATVPPRTIRIDLPSTDAFASGSAAVPATMRRSLDSLAAQFNGPLLQGWRMRIVGHADDRGSDVENDAMSLARAVSVARHFESQGVVATRLQTEGRGEREPQATNNQRYGRELNRRVELFLQRADAAPAAR